MSQNDDIIYQKNANLKPTESIRRAGTKNILISVCVAAATYYSLILIAKQFGASLGSDAYFFLSSLANLASGIIGSLLGTVFLPAFIKLLTKSDKSVAYSFASSIFSWCLVITIIIAFPIFICNEQFFLHASRFNATQLSHIYPLLIYFAPIFLIGVLSEFFRVIALSIGKFSTAAIAAIFPPFFLIIFILLFGENLHEESLIASLLLAKFIGLIMLVTVVCMEGIRIRFILAKNQHTFRFIKSSVPYWSANAVTNAAIFYFDYQASGLGAGIVTALAYANRIYMLPIVVFLNPILEISRVKFSQMQSEANHVAFSTYYNNLLRLSVYFSVPIAALYLTFSQEIISAMFQRGAFQAENVKVASSCLSIYAWSIPFVTIFMVNGRACESYQKLLWPSVFGTAGNLIMIVTTMVLSNLLGYKGIPMAKVAIDVIYLLPFGFVAIKLFGGSPQFGQVIKTLVESLAALIPAVILFTIDFDSTYNGPPFSLWLLIFCVIKFIVIYNISLILISSKIRYDLKILFQHRPLKL